MKYVFRTTKGFRFRFFLLFCTIILSTVTEALFPYAIGGIVDQIFYVKQMKGFLLCFFFYAGLYLFSQCLHGGLNYIWARLEVTYVVNIRKECFKHLLKLNAGVWTKIQSGDVMCRIEEDTACFLEFIHRSLFYVFANTVNLCISIGYLLHANFVIGIVAIVMTPLLAYSIRHFTEKLKYGHQEIYEQRGFLEAWVLEMMAGIMQWKVLHADEKVKGDFQRKIEQVIDKEKRIKYMEVEAESVNQALTLIGQLCIYCIAVNGITRGTMTVGQFVTCATYFSTCAIMFNALGKKITDISSNWVRIKRVEEFMSWEEEREAEGAQELRILAGSIVFEEVSFGYGDEKVLQDVNIKIAPGEKVAVVGKSGEGKSTLLNLLYRLYEPDSGTIYVDGQPLTTYTLSSLRGQIAVVHQESGVFQGSLRENIIFSDDRSQDARIMSILEGVHLRNLVESLTDGLDIIVGSDGREFSGGQKQRIAIARCIYRKPAILILDEATSALDSRTEEAVLTFLKKELPDTTVLSAAHRFSAVLASDKAIVMENGRISITGSHGDLLVKNELYQSLYTEYQSVLQNERGEDE